MTRQNQAKSANVKIHFCNISCKAAYQKLARPVTKEWLRQKYAVEGLTCPQIGLLTSRNPKAVWGWLKDFGIPTRPRGCNVGQLPKDGSQFKGKHHTPATKESIRQARLRDGHVPYLKNGKHWMAGKPKEEHPNWKGGATPERQSFYSSPEWAECVKAVWKRDDAKCRKCGLDNRTVLRGMIKFHIHHVDSFAIRERRAVLENLVLLCGDCHRWVHSKRNKKSLFIGRRA